MKIPKYGHIFYTDAFKERKSDLFRPDVMAKYKGEVLYFEIIVTHPISKEKEKYFK